ncbi:hypothetical protein [Micropruina sonneratiae]|uniref:hypothetical protein n=1 Tax=Micropruina sonneratiae TaxID=2986940 RepID=UPI002226B3E5|nr:hypothetical protein [Micropruina sp. KQZ13P-5]MCW3158673.1 hypothetical protein [Micropruina sp. KQZ13P-5]
MNGVAEYVVFYAPQAVQAKVARWRSMLIQRLISTAVSTAIGGAVWYFFADQVGAFGPWLVGSALVIGLVWVIVSVTGLLMARGDAKDVVTGPAFATTPAGVWVAGLWLSWPEIGAFRATPSRLGRSPRLRVEGRDGRSASVPMDYLTALPANIDSAVRALSGGRHWIDLSRLDD